MYIARISFNPSSGNKLVLFLTLVVLGKSVCFLDFEYKFVQTMAIGIANFLSANQLKVKFKTFMILGFQSWFFKSDSPTIFIHVEPFLFDI